MALKSYLPGRPQGSDGIYSNQQQNDRHPAFIVDEQICPHPKDVSDRFRFGSELDSEAGPVDIIPIDLWDKRRHDRELAELRAQLSSLQNSNPRGKGFPNGDSPQFYAKTSSEEFSKDSGSPGTRSVNASLNVDQILNAVWNTNSRKIENTTAHRPSGSVTARGYLETSGSFTSKKSSYADAKKYWDSAVIFGRSHLRELVDPSIMRSGGAEHVTELKILLRKSSQSLRMLLECGRELKEIRTCTPPQESEAVALLAREAILRSNSGKLRAALNAADQARAVAVADLRAARDEKEALSRAQAEEADRWQRQWVGLQAALQSERDRAARAEATLFRSLVASTRKWN
jgi:hypothetical protein